MLIKCLLVSLTMATAKLLFNHSYSWWACTVPLFFYLIIFCIALWIGLTKDLDGNR